MNFQGTGPLISGAVALVTGAAALVSAVLKAWGEIRKLREAAVSTNLTVAQLSQRSGDNVTAHSKPDVALVFKWAQEHRAANPYDLGSMNWERCLDDLGYPGGKHHELLYDSNGTLKYQ